MISVRWLFDNFTLWKTWWICGPKPRDLVYRRSRF